MSKTRDEQFETQRSGGSFRMTVKTSQEKTFHEEREFNSHKRSQKKNYMASDDMGGSGHEGDIQNKIKVKRNPNFSGAEQNQQQNAQTYNSSDDDIPLGFSRRKRLSSQSSVTRKFEAQSSNIVPLAREDDQQVQVKTKRDPYYPTNQVQVQNQNYQEETNNYNAQKSAREQQEDQDRVHRETEIMIEQKREEIQQRIREHDQAIRNEKDKVQISYQQQEKSQPQQFRQDPNIYLNQQKTDQQFQQQNNSYFQNISFDQQAKDNNMNRVSINPQNNAQIAFPSVVQQQQQQINQNQNQSQIYPPLLGNYQQPQVYPQYLNYGQAIATQPIQQQFPTHNYFPPQLVPNLPQYTNLDIPGHIDQNLKQMQETLQKLKQENVGLKGELNKKQVMNADIELNLSTFDKEKYQMHAQTNLKMKQQVEDMKRKDIELKSRLSSLQANKNYLNGRTATLGMDIDQQDKQEDALNRQINDFNSLIRDKESYIKQLMNELSQLKEVKESSSSELQVLAHKEEFMVNELIFKEDQLNEIILGNEEMRRKIQSGQSQSKYLLAENERLKKELSQLKEESAVLKASSDFIQNELMGLNEHLNEYEHKLVLSQTTIEQLQRQNHQGKNELAHYNATIAQQQQAYDELKNQLSLINDRNQRISMQNEMMMLRQSQHQEQLLQQMSVAQREKPKEEFGGQTSNYDEREGLSYQRNIPEPDSNYRLEAKNQGQGQGQNEQTFPEKKSMRQEQPQKNNNVEQRFEGSPYEEIKRKQKDGNSMSDTLKWGTDEDQFQTTNRLSIQQKNANENRDSYARQQQNNNKGTVGSLLNWQTDDENPKSNRASLLPAAGTTKRQVETTNSARKRGHEEDEGELLRGERSKSQKRADQMNELLRWEDDDDIRDKRLKQSDDNKYQMQMNSNLERSVSKERKKNEGKSMQDLMTWNKDSPFKDRALLKDADESMKWKPRQVQQPVIPQNESPSREGIEIRSKHYGQSMAGLLQFQEEDTKQLSALKGTRQNNTNSDQKKQNQQVYPPPKQPIENPTKTRYGAISINLGVASNTVMAAKSGPSSHHSYNPEKSREETTNNFQTPNRQQKISSDQMNKQVSATKNSQQSITFNTKKVSLDMMKEQKTSGLSTPKNKNYGEISQQIYQKQQSRKETLDKFLLQMQIEKNKLNGELSKIGEHPKTTQQYRRKEEIQQELQSLNSNILNTRTKLKQLKQ